VKKNKMNASITHSNFGDTVSDEAPAVSIVVPCRNEADHIETALESILVQEQPPGGFEVIVADGMSDDGTRGILFKLAKDNSRIRIIDNPGGIVSTGLNAAIRLARGSIIVRMDAHTSYAPDYIRQCVKLLAETAADNVGGPARTEAVNYMQSVICAAYHSPFSVGGARFHDVEYEGEVDTVPYGCWPREVFSRVGLFDEELVRNQDDEFNLRLKRGGGRIWQSPSIRSWYRPRESLSALFRQYMQYGYWKVRLIQKHKLPASFRHLVPGFFVMVLILLPLFAVWWSFAAWAWLGLSATYLTASVVASLFAAKKHGWNLLPLLPIVFGCYHLSYGFGFVHGVLDFLILRRRPVHSYTALTRPSSEDLIR
jgi:succinoglycan biosynthesis protein ExoA